MAEACPLKPSDHADRFWSKVKRSEGCWVWLAAKNRRGYGKFCVKSRGRARFFGAHRFAWMLCSGPIPASLFVLHKCDNPSCVRPDHLFLGTAADNTADMIAKGRLRVGEHGGHRNGRAVMSHETADEVRRLYAAGGTSMPQLAHDFGISTSQVFRIIHRHHWRSQDRKAS